MGSNAECVDRSRRSEVCYLGPGNWFRQSPGQELIARHLPFNIDGDRAHIIESPYGHDAFLIEDELIAAQVARLLATPGASERAAAPSHSSAMTGASSTN